MRVMMPNGTVMTIEKVCAVSEQRIAFNGREVRLCECATDIDSANGVSFLSKSNVHDIATGGTALLGNLSNDFVREVLASLVRQGYVDLSGLKLQKAQPMVSSYVFDNGASGAYMLQGFEANMCCANALGYHPFMAGDCPVESKAKDVEEDREEDCADE